MTGLYHEKVRSATLRKKSKLCIEWTFLKAFLKARWDLVNRSRYNKINISGRSNYVLRLTILLIWLGFMHSIIYFL